MKALITITAVLACFITSAQTAWLEKTEDADRIYFSVSREANVNYYVIEGANDSIHFEVIGTVASQGNTVNSRTYFYDNADKSYRNYKIKVIDHSGSCTASQYIYTDKVNSKPPQNKTQFNANPGLISGN